MEHLPIVQFIFPLAAALNFFISPLSIRKSKVFSLLASVLHLGVTLALIQVLVESGKERIPILVWDNPFGIHVSMFLGKENAVFLLMNALTLLFTIFLSWDEKRKLHRVYYFLIFLLAWAINCCLLSEELPSFLIMEEATIFIFLLFMKTFGHRKRGPLDSDEASESIEYEGPILMGSFCLLVFAMARPAGEAGDLMIRNWSFWAGLTGLLLRGALFPFHILRTHSPGQMSRSAFIISLGIVFNIAAFGVMKFIVPLYPDMIERYREPLVMLCLCSVWLGSIFAFFQKDFYRILSYSSLGYFGQTMAGMLVGQTWAVKGALFRLLSLCISVLGAFLLRDLSTKGWSQGLSRVIKVGGIIVFCNFIALPGMMGFGGSFMLLSGMAKALPLWAALTGLGDLLIPIALFQFIKNWKKSPLNERMELDEGIEEVLTLDREKDYLGLFLLIMICSLLVGLGFFPQQLEKIL